MFGTIEITDPVQGDKVARKRNDDVGGQVNFKANQRLWNRLESISRVLGIDMANLARMIISENISIYEERARRVEDATPPD